MKGTKEKEEEIQQKIGLLIERQEAQLDKMKENLKLPGLKPVTKGIIERAIQDKEESLNEIKNGKKRR